MRKCTQVRLDGALQASANGDVVTALEHGEEAAVARLDAPRERDKVLRQVVEVVGVKPPTLGRVLLVRVEA